MSLHNLNLNLLPVLRELLHHRSVTGAGLALGRSPSAVSQGLTQLRAIFDDPLMVRAGGGMVLTSRAEQLIEPVEIAYGQMERVLKVDRFDPAATDRQFVIAATDYDEFANGPKIALAVGKLAPNVRIRFVGVGRELAGQILARYVDFALMPDFLLADLGSDRMRSVPVASSETVALMRREHPLSGQGPIDREALDRWGQVAFLPSWEAIGRRSTLVVNRQPLRAVTVVSQIVMLTAHIAGTDRIALAPDVIADRLAPAFGLTHCALGFDEPVVRSVLAWGPNQHADPAHRWFRDCAVQALREPRRSGTD